VEVVLTSISILIHALAEVYLATNPGKEIGAGVGSRDTGRQCREKGGMSNLDALQARVKHAGGDTAATARVLYEIGAELDAADAERILSGSADNSDDENEVANVFEQFFCSDDAANLESKSTSDF
jgi:hypothetical protein